MGITTVRITSNVPGPTGRRYYGEGEDEHFFLWRYQNVRQLSALVVYIKPGQMFNMGERVMDPHTSSSPALGEAIDLVWDTLRWPMVSIEFRPPHSADSPKREPFSNRPWPGPLLSARKAMVYLREHWNDATLWGTGGSIDPRKIVVFGSSSGHAMANLLTMVPPSKFPYHGVNGLHSSLDPVLQDHRPNAVVGFIGQIDWTQYTPNPADTTGPFTFDLHQYFFAQQGRYTWANYPLGPKKSASPWWWLPYGDPKSTVFWQAWGRKPGSGPGAQLTPADWSPGTVRGTSPKAFYDPHHYFQAKPWHDALVAAGYDVRTIWGGNDDNPTGPNNDNIPDTTSTAQDVLRFLQQRLRWPSNKP